MSVSRDNSLEVQRPSWPLVIIGASDFVEGATRIQKFAFLGFKRIKGITQKGFYDDWQASKYGPFSPNLANDIGALLETGFIGKFKVRNAYGYFVDRFALTDSGRNVANITKAKYKQETERLAEIVKTYEGKDLIDILHDVYSLYPEFAYRSVIRPKVARRDYESDSYLNPPTDETE